MKQKLKMTAQSDNEKYAEAPFPELREISDLDLRRKVINWWLTGLMFGFDFHILPSPMIPTRNLRFLKHTLIEDRWKC
jgi:hypothetical protein